MLIKTIKSGETLVFGDKGEVRLTIASRNADVLIAHSALATDGCQRIRSGEQLSLDGIGWMRPRIDRTRTSRITVALEIESHIKIGIRPAGALSAVQ